MNHIRCRYIDSPEELLGAVQKERKILLQLLQKIHGTILSRHRNHKFINYDVNKIIHMMPL